MNGYGDQLDYAYETKNGNEAGELENKELIRQTVECLEQEKKYQVKGKSLREYLDEKNKVWRKLPAKYHKFIELFVKREQKLPNHPDKYQARILLIPGAELPQVK